MIPLLTVRIFRGNSRLYFDKTLMEIVLMASLPGASPPSTLEKHPLAYAPRLLRPFALALSLAYFQYYTPSARRRSPAGSRLDRLARWHALAPAPATLPLRRRRALALQLALLHAARLLDLTAAIWRPSPLAGDWLRAPAARQIRQVRQAVADGEPGTTGDRLGAVARALDLGEAITPDVAAWAVQFLDRLIDQTPAASIPAALTLAPDCCRLRLHETTPPALLFDLVQVGEWQPFERDGGELILTPRSVARAARRGYTAQPAARLVETAAARPPDSELRRRLNDWAARGRSHRLSPAYLLETDRDDQLAAILAQRRFRPHILRVLSPRCAAVRPAIAPALDKWLAGRGFYLSDEAGVNRPTAKGQAIGGEEEHLSLVARSSSLAYEWFALRVLVGLGDLAPLPVPPPHEALAATAATLDLRELGELEALATRYLDQWRTALRGRDAFLPASGPPDPPLLDAVRDALRHERTLVIEYRPPWNDDLHVPGGELQGGSETRADGGERATPCPPALDAERYLTRVRPLWLEQRGDLYYLHTYCYRAEAERTFRLDRVTHYE